jgi:hypothetical protein
MRKLLLFAGLPRSGTTYFYHLCGKNLGMRTFFPDEMRHLANPSIVERMMALFSDIHQMQLRESNGKGGFYSNWGAAEVFVSDMARLFSTCLAALCRRDYIERDTIDSTYAEQMKLFRDSTLRQAIHQPAMWKQPTIEMNWRSMERLFSLCDIRWVLCIRDPYLVFTSMQSLGWTKSVETFNLLAKTSYQSSKDLIETGRAIAVNVDMPNDDVDELISYVAKHLNCLIPQRPKYGVSSFSKNASKRAKESAISASDFMTKFEECGAAEMHRFLQDCVGRVGQQSSPKCT